MGLLDRFLWVSGVAFWVCVLGGLVGLFVALSQVRTFAEREEPRPGDEYPDTV